MPEQTTMPATITQNQDDSKEVTNPEENVKDTEEKPNEQLQPKPDIDLYDEPKLSEIIIEYYDGERQKGLFHGYGTAYFIGGNIYQGEFHEGEMHGSGRYVWYDGVIYEGDFNRNEITGAGKYTWTDGSQYEGEVYAGLRHGKGSYRSSSCPSSYIGQWILGKRQGWGVMYYDVDGLSYYDGQWQDNNRHGFGVRRYRSGNVYEGEWEDGLRNGKGTMRWLDQNETYSGIWKDGVQHGHGVHTWFVSRAVDTQFPVRNQYIGNWQQGKRHGFGVFHYANGAKYDGQWSNNMKHGKGKFYFKNGTVFDGSFEEDHMVEYPLHEDPNNRPKSPLGSPSRLKSPLGSHTDESIDGSFESNLLINIENLLTSTDVFDMKDELAKIRNVMLRYVSPLKRFYRFYSRLGHSASVDNTFCMRRFQFWCFLRDCHIHHYGLTLTDMNRIIAKHTNNRSGGEHDPNQILLIRDYFDAIAILASAIYGAEFNGDQDKLAKCLRKLITENILNSATHVKGPFLHDSRRSTTAMQLMPRTLELFHSVCLHRQNNSNGFTLRMRTFLLLLKDLGLIDENLTAKHVIDILGANNPNALQDGDCNLEIEMTFLEFFEALVSCAPISIRLSSDRESIVTRPSTVMSARPLSEPVNMDIGAQMQMDTSINSITKINETTANDNQTILPVDEIKESVKTSENSEAQKPGDTALLTPVQSTDSRADFVDGKNQVKTNAITRDDSMRNASGIVRSESGREIFSEQILDERAISQIRPSYETPMSGASQISESLLEEDKVTMIANPIGTIHSSGRESNTHSSPDAYIAWAKKIHLFFNERLFVAAEQANLIVHSINIEDI
ncbi:uncharacterized protein TRIADDRAFT_58077 [Trichoplax adhaerens]|uniref:Uncharacterized protein n=1 Tax=Trichoplax adhaerens TaxID=10228 RepID=B3S2M3_TRIAD|nr:hypothetical protein TRIADDRAFT_58077 [Trichoplax adhaerens]EDV23121.1 hypothetical protein TRIADDRAFT_58077 [Trichoplax adhaerens]|eukprot:XP_002114031.1 hypothetical protein TRIADDRAFT_58077 [Trichoplax adhaerens]